MFKKILSIVFILGLLSNCEYKPIYSNLNKADYQINILEFTGDKELNKFKTLPYRDNYGYFFSSGPNTWHGMEKKEIIKERRCLQVNYVTFKTDWKVD